MEDFIEGAAIFSDIYASSGMKIVLSGTDSLGFAFTSKEQLYDRCIMIHTTFIPYREFENVLGKLHKRWKNMQQLLVYLFLFLTY